jgi:hypothetical protein
VRQRFLSMEFVPALRTMSATSNCGRFTYSSCDDLPFLSTSASSGLGVARLPLQEVAIASGFFKIVMAKPDLDGAEVGAGFEHVGSEAMAEHVGIDTFFTPPVGPMTAWSARSPASIRCCARRAIAEWNIGAEVPRLLNRHQRIFAELII